jgi:hypothetical protein
MTEATARELADLFERLAGSKFRSRFKLGLRDRGYLAQKGMDMILRHAREFVDRRLGLAHPPNDGKQTPMRGHPVFVAQHATATCCRSCLSKWHGIDAGRELNDAERRYIVAVIGRWLHVQCGILPKPSESNTSARHGVEQTAQPDLFTDRGQ